MCFDVIGCHAVDTVIYDSRWHSRYRACSPIISFISSSHPISFLALPPLPGSLLSACFKQSPAPGRGRSQRIEGLRLRAGCRFACSPSCRAALSLSLVRYCCSNDVIAAVPSACLPRRHPFRPSSRYRPDVVITLRLLFPSLPIARLGANRLPPACLLCPRPPPSPIEPAGHILPASRPAILVEERGGDTSRLRATCCSDVITLLLAYPMPFPRLGRFGSHPSHPRRLVRFASTHVPTEVRSAAVRMPCGRLCLLPRLSVSIVFKMFSCQSFKILRLFGIARLGEYRGRSCPIASPSHLRFASAVSG